MTDVRVQRLQEISDEDAKAEGVPPFSGERADFRSAFAFVWDTINHKRMPWASSPWVWAISFERNL